MNKASAKHAKLIIEKINYITIATVDEFGQPWNSPVYKGFDEDYNFYWASWKDNQHSKNIKANPRVFLSIYDSTQAPGTGWGVYVKAKAHAMTDKAEMEKVLEHFYGRRALKPRKPEEFIGTYPRRLFKAVPEQFWMNDSSTINGNYIDTRTEIKLP